MKQVRRIYKKNRMEKHKGKPKSALCKRTSEDGLVDLCSSVWAAC